MKTKQKCPIKCTTDWLSLIKCTFSVYGDKIKELKR